jgi:hypothetical protein
MAKNKNKNKNKKGEEGKPKKKGWKLKVFGVVAFLVGLFVWYGFQPLQGTIHVGICRTFAELQLEYPPTMKVIQADAFDRSQRVYYTYLNEYGQQRSDVIDCRFAREFTVPDYTIERITVNRVPVAAEKVKKFNQSLPAIIAGHPDLVIPFPADNDLKKLKTD